MTGAQKVAPNFSLVFSAPWCALAVPLYTCTTRMRQKRDTLWKKTAFGARMQISSEPQRAPKGPPNEDPSKSGLRVSFCSFWPLLHTKQLFSRQLSLPKTCVWGGAPFEWAPLLKCLILMVASAVCFSSEKPNHDHQWAGPLAVAESHLSRPLVWGTVKVTILFIKWDWRFQARLNVNRRHLGVCGRCCAVTGP